MSTDLLPYINTRAKLVDELIARIQHYHIIRVSNTLASGKTTVMDLVVNKLLEKYGQTMPIHVLLGWDKENVRGATGWSAYLKRETDVHDDKWLTYPAYLLLDEAQQSYWDGDLWADLFKRVEPGASPFIILFTSYGSPHRGFAEKSTGNLLWSLALNSRFHCDRTKISKITRRTLYCLGDRLVCYLMRMKQWIS